MLIPGCSDSLKPGGIGTAAVAVGTEAGDINGNLETGLVLECDVLIEIIGGGVE